MVKRDTTITTSRRVARLSAWRREALGMAAIALLALTARGTLADHYHVPSGSMLPGVEAGDRIAVNKAAYGLRVPLSQRWLLTWDGPRAGDVVVLASPEDGTILLKRVVAGPGEEILVRGGRLRVDGQPVPLRAGADGGLVETLGGEEHPVRLTRAGGPDLGPVRVPDGHYLVMGDNRGDSRDGRSFGWVPREAILGRTVGIFARQGRPTWRPI
jgi:signal peptidase I